MKKRTRVTKGKPKARKRTGKSARASVKRKATAARKRRPSPAQRIKRIEETFADFAPVVVGGRIHVGETGWITPTKQGFAALDRALAVIARSRATFTLDLRVRFNGPNGQQTERGLDGIGIPRAADVKGTLIEHVHAVLRRAVFATLKDEFGEMSPQLRSNLTKYARKQAMELLREMKAGRRAKFHVSIYREIPTKGAQRATPTKAGKRKSVRRSTRQRRR